MYKKLSINVISAIFQVVINSIVFFLLYRYLINKLGIELLGVWALVLSTTSVANLANFGITSGLVKFVAEYLAKDKEILIGELLTTAFLSISMLFILLIFLIYICASILLKYVIDVKFIPDALQILPYSLMSLFINGLSSVFTSAIEGYQKNYIRNLIYIVTAIFYFIFSVYLVPIYFLKGVAIAQVIQALLILILSVVFLKKSTIIGSIGNIKWNKGVFLKLVNYGLKFQVTSICQMIFEPTTKILISKFSGLSTLGFYEMASRLVNQIRAISVNANQVVVPVVTNTIISKDRFAFINLYKKMLTTLVLINIPVFTLLLSLAPLISHIWIGYYEPIFIFSVLILSIITFINILCGPSYFSALAEGKLDILMFSHILMAVINFIFGFILGKYLDGYGVIIAWGATLIFGSFFIILKYQKLHQIGFDDIFGNTNLAFILFGFICWLIHAIIFLYLKINNLPILFTIFSFILTSVVITLLFIKFNFRNKILHIYKSFNVK